MLNRSLLTTLCLVLLVPAVDSLAAESVPNRKASLAFLETFQPVVEIANKSTVRLLVDGKDVALGAVVSADGAVLTKASEIKSGRLTVKSVDGIECAALVMATNDDYDLSLVRVPGFRGKPIEWVPSRTATVGNWLAVPGLKNKPLAVGVVGVSTRTLEFRPFLGVQFDMNTTKLLITDIVPFSAAERAGIKPKDIILAINQTDMTGRDALMGTLRKYRIGDKVELVVERNGKKVEVKAILGGVSDDSPPPLMRGGKPNRGDVQNSMGSTLSDRRNGFATILQHDAVIAPSDCGGPIVDLDGKAIGLNICRAGRTETHAVPSEVVEKILVGLLANQDQVIESAPMPRLK